MTSLSQLRLVLHIVDEAGDCPDRLVNPYLIWMNTSSAWCSLLADLMFQGLTCCFGEVFKFKHKEVRNQGHACG